MLTGNEKNWINATWIVSSHSALVSSRKRGRGGGWRAPPFEFGTTFEKDPGRKMRGAHAVGAYLSTTLPELTLAAWNSKLAAPPRRTVLSALSQKAKREEERSATAEDVVMRRGRMARNTWPGTGRCGGVLRDDAIFIVHKIVSTKRSYPFSMNAYATW